MNRTSTRPLLPSRLATALVLIAATCAGLGAGCAEFDPASLITRTRVLGARVEVEGAPERAAPAPGETARVTWLMAAPGTIPPVAWTFALCPAGSPLGCPDRALATYEGTASPPSVTFTVPSLDALGGASTLGLYGRICAGGSPTIDARGLAGCSGGGDGTTVSVAIRLQQGNDTNHNPVADRGLTFDGQPWAPLTEGASPCGVGPRIAAGSPDHALTLVTIGSDRETYPAIAGDPPVPVEAREALQLSSFVTLGELASPYAFVEADDPADAPVATTRWDAPAARDVVAETPVTFTFVVRDGRGGIDLVTRSVCVTP